MKEVSVVDVTEKTIKALVKLCDTGRIDFREDTVKELLCSAFVLNISGVIRAGCEYLQRHLSPPNCLGLARYAEQHNCHFLLKVATELACQNFDEVWRNEEFIQLNAYELVKLLANDNLNVPSEETVFEAFIDWLKHDSDTREKHIPHMLGVIPSSMLMPTVSRSNNGQGMM